MPQMMPLNWLSLLLFFLIIFYLFNNMNYYNFNYKNKSFLQSKKMLHLTWQW